MMESHVRSADGTRLRTVCAGHGPPLVLIHGTIGTKADWAAVIPRLADSFTVIAFDRQGRAESDDGADYSIERECEDVLAVIDAVGKPAHVVGHSFGAVLALLVAAQASECIRRLVLYEPPLGDAPGDRRWLHTLEERLDSGDPDCAAELFLKATGATASEIDHIRINERVWRSMRGAVRAVPREVQAAELALRRAPEIADAIGIPTLVLLGSEQDDPTYSGVRGLAERMPLGQFGQVPGRHLAMLAEPDVFVRVVYEFLDE